MGSEYRTKPRYKKAAPKRFSSVLHRSFSQERRGSRSVRRAVRQDELVPRIGRRHVLPAGERRPARPDRTRVRHRRIRMHDVHRQLRAAARVRHERHRIGKSGTNDGVG